MIRKTWIEASIQPKYWIKADRNRLERHTTHPTIYGYTGRKSYTHSFVIVLLLLFCCCCSFDLSFCLLRTRALFFRTKTQTKWWHKQACYNNYNEHKNDQLQLHNDCTTSNILKCHETNAIKMRIIYRHCFWTNTSFSINSDVNLSPCMDREQNRIELSLSRWASSINWQFNSIHSMWTLNMVKLTREFRAQIRGALLIDDPFAIHRLKSVKTAFPVFLLRITFKE